ncbi:hypothetical protein ABEH28_13120 [Pseudomonas sp. Ps21-P2]|uniref:hypothetical protein n=1 Tax=Pseudomonas sp. Ps21-P2 TaxID=3080331 RepID=UPI00320A60F9
MNNKYKTNKSRFCSYLFLIFSSLLFTAQANAALTAQGSHPELLGSATCSGGVTGSYALYGNRFGISIRNSGNIGYHPSDITPKNLGSAGIVYIEDAPGASVNGFGSDGMGLYNYNGKTYFVGPYYNTRTAYFEFQICYTNIATPPAPPAGPTFISSGYEDQNASCPADRPSGYLIQRRTFENWSDGRRNESGWSTIADYCSAIRSSIQSEARYYGCPSGQSGQIVQSRTYEVWTDGSVRNYSAWNVSGNSCVSAPMTANPTQRRELCDEGYTGQITYHWVVYYTNDSYSAYDADGKLISYTLSTPHQQELLLSNTCTLIPSQGVASVPGHETVTCDAYYNVVKGTYIGDVVKYGNYVSSYDSNKKQTNNVFNVTSIDVTQCVQDPEKSYSNESITEACGIGQSGIITKTRTVATAPNGTKSYPSGTVYTISSNTCAGTSVDNSPVVVAAAAKTGLIENLSLTSSMLSDPTYSTKLVDSLKFQSIKAGETHRLNIVVNDLSPGKYNAQNVTNVVKAFRTAVGSGAEFKITLPRSIDKYAGNGEIQSGKGLNLTSSELNGSKLTVKYMDSADKKTLSMPVEKSADIQLFNGDLTGVNLKTD